MATCERFRGFTGIPGDQALRRSFLARCKNALDAAFAGPRQGVRLNPGLILATAIDGLSLRPLTVRDARVFFDLVGANRDHLQQFGNYADLVGSKLEDIIESFTDPPDDSLRMGVWSGRELAGRVDLNLVSPDTFVLGYWLSLAYTGRGYATASCRALLEHACSNLGARDFWAGVTHGNQKSVAVLSRLGFAAVETLPDRTRFHLKV